MTTIEGGGVLWEDSGFGLVWSQKGDRHWGGELSRGTRILWLPFLQEKTLEGYLEQWLKRRLASVQSSTVCKVLLIKTTPAVQHSSIR